MVGMEGNFKSTCPDPIWLDNRNRHYSVRQGIRLLWFHHIRRLNPCANDTRTADHLTLSHELAIHELFFRYLCHFIDWASILLLRFNQAYYVVSCGT